MQLSAKSRLDHEVCHALWQQLTDILLQRIIVGQETIMAHIGRWRVQADAEYIALLPSGVRYLIPPRLSLIIDGLPNSEHSDQVLDILCTTSSSTEETVTAFYTAVGEVFCLHQEKKHDMKWDGIGSFVVRLAPSDPDKKIYAFIPEEKLSRKINKPFEMFSPALIKEGLEWPELTVVPLENIEGVCAPAPSFRQVNPVTQTRENKVVTQGEDLTQTMASPTQTIAASIPQEEMQKSVIHSVAPTSPVNERIDNLNSSTIEDETKEDIDRSEAPQVSMGSDQEVSAVMTQEQETEHLPQASSEISSTEKLKEDLDKEHETPDMERKEEEKKKGAAFSTPSQTASSSSSSQDKQSKREPSSFNKRAEKKRQKNKSKRWPLTLFIITGIVIFASIFWALNEQKGIFPSRRTPEPLPAEPIVPPMPLEEYPMDSLNMSLSEQEEASFSAVPAEASAPIQTEKEEGNDIVPEEEGQKPETPSHSVRITIQKGRTLSSYAREYLGNSHFWIYIYMANKSIIQNPDILPAGKKIRIPATTEYPLDPTNPIHIEKAKKLCNRQK